MAERQITLTNARLTVRANELMQRVSFTAMGAYTLQAKVSSAGYAYLQGSYDEPDVHTGVVEKQYTRRWMLSPEQTDSEIVATAFKLCLTSMEHRTREGFRFMNERIYSPHYDVLDLVEICRQGRADNGGRPPLQLPNPESI